MIIPYSNNEDTFHVGDNIIFTKQVNIDFCIITIGHKAKIIGKDNPRQESEPWIKYKLIDSDGNIFEKIESKNFTQIYSYKEAKIIFEDKKAKHMITAVCRRNCPHKTMKYWDRWEEYLACEILIKENKKSDLCEPTISCLKYIDDVNLSPEIIQYIRKQKFKKLIYNK